MPKAKSPVYYRAEVQCMGDVVKDGKLSQKEFLRLMKLLGLPEAEKAGGLIFSKTKKAAGDKMSADEYVALMMSDASVESKTSMWRELFAQFDTNNNAYASRQEIVDGLKKMGINIGDDIRRKIEKMDTDKDGKIFYGDFLKMQILDK